MSDVTVQTITASLPVVALFACQRQYSKETKSKENLPRLSVHTIELIGVIKNILKSRQEKHDEAPTHTIFMRKLF